MDDGGVHVVSVTVELKDRRPLTKIGVFVRSAQGTPLTSYIIKELSVVDGGAPYTYTSVYS
jgi:hypothetical protein